MTDIKTLAPTLMGAEYSDLRSGILSTAKSISFLPDVESGSEWRNIDPATAAADWVKVKRLASDLSQALWQRDFYRHASTWRMAVEGLAGDECDLSLVKEFLHVAIWLRVNERSHNKQSLSRLLLGMTIGKILTAINFWRLVGGKLPRKMTILKNLPFGEGEKSTPVDSEDRQLFFAVVLDGEEPGEDFLDLTYISIRDKAVLEVAKHRRETRQRYSGKKHRYNNKKTYRF